MKYNKQEIEIFKQVIKDYYAIKNEINNRIKKGYKIEDLFDYIRHLSSCNITNYQINGTFDDYFDFNYCDMCLSIYNDSNVYLGDTIEVWNDKECYYVDTLTIQELEKISEEEF